MLEDINQIKTEILQSINSSKKMPLNVNGRKKGFPQNMPLEGRDKPHTFHKKINTLVANF